MTSFSRILTMSLMASLGLLNFLSAQPASPTDSPAPRSTTIAPGSPGVRFALGGGYTYRLGKEMPNSSSYARELSDQLRHGYNLGGELHYVFASGIGLGVNANFVQSSVQASSATEHQNLFYVGPSMLLRIDGRKAAFIGAVGVGGLFLSDKITYSRLSGKITGSTFGAHVSLGGEYKLSPATAFGLKLSVNVGAIKTLKSGGESVSLDEGFSASSLMLTAFFSFRGHKK